MGEGEWGWTEGQGQEIAGGTSKICRKNYLPMHTDSTTHTYAVPPLQFAAQTWHRLAANPLHAGTVDYFVLKVMNAIRPNI